jgi:stage IV sporulation protein FB
VTVATVAGVRLGVHWLYVLLLALAAASGFAVHALILLGSLVAHELAHLAAAWALEVDVEAVDLTPLGGVARLDSRLEIDPQAEMSVALAGPFQSFLLAGLALFLTADGLWDRGLVEFFFQTNASLAFFNLVPALPLDGGRALRGLLAQRWGYRRVTAWLVLSGRACGLLMLLFAAALLASGRIYPTALVGGAYLFWIAGKEVEDAVYRSFRRFMRKREEVLMRRVLPGRQVVAVAGTRLAEVMAALGARGYHTVLVVDEQLAPLGMLTEADLITAFQERGPQVPVEQLLR